MMNLKGLATILWLTHCLAIAIAASYQFSGGGYMEYNFVSNAKHKPINSDIDELSVQFTTVQPYGLLFHARGFGDAFADYVTLEIVGGRIRYAMRYGRRQDFDDAHEVFLGKNLDNGKIHTVNVMHNKKDTIIKLDEGSEYERVETKINTYYEKLDIDIAIYVGGAQDFKNLLSVQSNSYFLGCLSDVQFKPQNQPVIKFLDEGVAVTYPSDMKKACTFEPYAPFTFNATDSSFVCPVRGLDTAPEMRGSFLFRTYQGPSGTLLKQSNGQNGFEISYSERFISLSLTGASGTPATISYNQNSVTSMNNGNWHQVKFSISASTLVLEVGSDKDERAVTSFPKNFFKGEVNAGGFIGCMRNLKINNEECKPSKDSKITNVELNSICNITDFCVFSPCLHGGTCTQTGKSFNCGCRTTSYLDPMCQFSKYMSSCASIKWEAKSTVSKDYSVDFDGPGPLKPASVFCNMTADPPITRVLTKNIAVKLDPLANSPISQIIQYIPDVKDAESLASNSENCTQFISFGCRQAKLLNVGGETLANWVSADGHYQDYWGGAHPNSKSCACGETKTCLDPNKKCNCDADRDVWTEDSGDITSTTPGVLPITEVVFRDVKSPGQANYTVGSLYCSGNNTNSATFVNEDGMIKLPRWEPPSDGVISLYFRTPYPKGAILYNGDPNKEYFQLQILNETTVRLFYNIGNGAQNIDLNLKNRKVNDRSWHKVVIYRNMKEFGLKLDKEHGVHENPLFLERNLDLNDQLYVGGYQYDVSKGFVGCIRGLTINGEVQNLRKLANDADYVLSGCGAACKQHACRQGGKCLDNYNVYFCDCSKTPFYGYFCHQDKGASFDEKDSQLIYTYPRVESVPNIDIVIGFKLGDKKPCSGDIIRIDSKDTQQFFLLSLDSASKKLKFSFRGPGGESSIEIDPLPGQSFCKNRHTFALTRRGMKLNYTVDEVKQPKYENAMLDGLFSKMEKITVGRQGDKGFKGCITGVKVTQSTFGGTPNTVEPIKAFVYDGVTSEYSVTGLTRDSKEKCGPDPAVPPIPTPRPVGGPKSPATTSPATTDPGEQAESDNKTAIIVIVVLILVLLLVVLVIVIYWYWARHKGEYHTHEDDEELKGMDPYIDPSAPRKPHAEEPEKKKEWYI